MTAANQGKTSIALNGRLLHEIRLPLPSYEHRPGIHYLVYLPRDYTVRRIAGDLVLSLPALLVLELYRSGVLHSDPNEPISVALDGEDAGLHRITDFRYPDYAERQDVVIRLTGSERYGEG